MHLLLAGFFPFGNHCQIGNSDRGGYGNADKLTAALLADFDEVWFFGIRLANNPGAPDNELTDAEVAALEDWMTTGGVLMTGDHANRHPDAPLQHDCSAWDAPSAIESLGPVSCAAGRAIQQSLRTRSGARSATTPRCRPGLSHRSISSSCKRMSGHNSSSSRRSRTWPSGPTGQPRPEVIAQGTDKRNGNIYDIVIAYDGSTAGAGRIVADSTWHHYFNVNLKGFPAGGNVRSQLAQFYVNLAFWLAPPAKREQIACWLRWRLVHNPSVEMAYGTHGSPWAGPPPACFADLGGPCILGDVFEPVVTAAVLPTDALQPPEELLLGGVVHAYLEAFERADGNQVVEADEDANVLVARGLRLAHDDFLTELDQTSERARRGRDFLEEQLGRSGYGTAG